MAVIESPPCRENIPDVSESRFALSLPTFIVMGNACTMNHFMIDDQPLSGEVP
jgi:hypothetical protein